MKVLVTGSSGHLGEAMARRLKELNHEVLGLDLIKSPFTSHIGSITDRSFVKECMEGIETVFHTATLHKPHVATHDLQQFIDTNITGTLHLLQESLAAGVKRFIFTSTTSVFGEAMSPPAGSPAAWVTEALVPVPKNIYGVTKLAAEDLCQLFYRNHGLPCIVLRTSRFFPEDDDEKEKRAAFFGENLKTNEFLFRRVELEDVVQAQLLAAEKAQDLGFGKYIISATSPFLPEDLAALRTNAAQVVGKYFPDYQKVYEGYNWKMLTEFDRVYVNEKARAALGWKPKYDFSHLLEQLKLGNELQSPLARLVGSKGYHARSFSEGPYPVD
ncbi:Nucleoside-diphosphate-sugar epimerase [Pedobacter steynii]|uniref:Nucleoside-diphosphate-sugar epimerase n=1 Tax=Pedobacter steynii TaxID=430522 RepID=A0A1G9ZCA6_9SPHI|nr:NAD(P)-dependent oxidoreductase [Pedobacter steynii]NQX40014.1 NAD(P)-dependent oxidoreductase [Pedobacter steynii]SDN18894.1 Nucleoside-diphosphate-sugar epimerase [Pedobacter steynii]